MRKARYDMKQVICKNASLLGYATRIVRPGYWIATNEGRIGRVVARITRTDGDGENCAGYLCVAMLMMEHTHACIRWVNPDDVACAYAKPPRVLLAWITGDEWPTTKDGAARIIAMSEHGTLSDQFIGNRDKPEQAYNARPEYVKQFILGA